MRPIDADVLIPALGELKTIITGVMYSEDVVNTIINAPTIDAEPVKHGRWIWADGWREYKCSCCGYIGRFFKYCPNCGAKMDGGNDE